MPWIKNPSKYITLSCHKCKKEIVKYKCQIKNNKHTFCSRTCQVSHKVSEQWKNPVYREFQYQKGLTQHPPIFYGKDHWNWKGGLSRPWEHTKTKQYKDWRFSVFARDSYTCQMCGIKGGNLVAHHVAPWSKFPQYRYEIWNGKTLHDSCHKQLHKELSNA